MNLSRRQKRIVKLNAAGMRSQDIAKRIGSGIDTVKQEIVRVYDLTGLSNRVELALWSIKHLGY